MKRAQQFITRVALILAAGLILLTAGCATTGGTRGMTTINITASGVASLEGKPVMLSDLPRKLRARNVRPEDGVRVILEAGASQQLMNSVTTTLARGGYPRVVFIRAKPPSATTRH